jgi:hypothetical protein
MRRTATIRLTLLPILASAAMARAQPAEPRLSPPGMTPPSRDLDEPPCVVDDDPRDECRGHTSTVVSYAGIHFGGFGHYFGGRGHGG